MFTKECDEHVIIKNYQVFIKIEKHVFIKFNVGKRFNKTDYPYHGFIESDYPKHQFNKIEKLGFIETDYTKKLFNNIEKSTLKMKNLGSLK